MDASGLLETLNKRDENRTELSSLLFPRLYSLAICICKKDASVSDLEPPLIFHPMNDGHQVAPPPDLCPFFLAIAHLSHPSSACIFLTSLAVLHQYLLRSQLSLPSSLPGCPRVFSFEFGGLLHRRHGWTS